MNWRTLLPIFTTVFLAELGDKTQLATMLFAADGRQSRWGVFVAAALALVLSTALAVLLGGVIERYVPGLWLRRVAGVGFIAVGLWTLLDKG